MSEDLPTRVAPSDEYEANAVAVGQHVRHRDKHVARTAVLALMPMALIALIATIALLFNAEPALGPIAAVIPALGLVATLYLALTRAVVRTAVTDANLEVNWGPKAVSVPLGAIMSCEVEAASNSRLRVGMQIWAPKGSVILKWNDGSKERAFQFPAEDPGLLVANIKTAMLAAGASALTGVRANVSLANATGVGVAESVGAAERTAQSTARK